MRNYLFSLLFIIALVSTNAYAQVKTPPGHFTEVVRNEKGDLNYDGRDDKVVVKMDIVDATRPLLLQVFLSQPNRKLKLAVSSKNVIEPQYPAEKKGKANGFQIPDFFIENGNLAMVSEINEGNITHTFKYQRGNFELIRIKRFTYDGANTTIDTELNLLTGLKTATEKRLGSDKIVSRRKENLNVKPLVKLQAFNYADREKW